VVTGAAAGIGRAISARLIADGADVVAMDVDPVALASTAADLGARYVPFTGDVASEQDCAAAVSGCVRAFGRIDVMAAHAGVATGRPFLEIDAEHWRRHMSVNVDGAAYCAVHAARAMRDAGTPGSIVITASVNGFHVEETMGAYNVSKGALLTLVRSAAVDLGRYRIRVNGVAPGVVRTKVAEWVIDDPVLGPRYLRTMPLGRFGEPEDVANAVSWLSSDEASYVTGQTLVIDGGQTLGIVADQTEDDA
jgi:NAD(P)-dependent dehydrogenase (short-subunit alcohol dehydrogenase family)